MNILLHLFLKDIHEGHWSLENSDDEKSNFAAKVKNLESRKKNEKERF